MCNILAHCVPRPKVLLLRPVIGPSCLTYTLKIPHPSRNKTFPHHHPGVMIFKDHHFFLRSCSMRTEENPTFVVSLSYSLSRNKHRQEGAFFSFLSRFFLYFFFLFILLFYTPCSLITSIVCGCLFR